MENTPYQNRQGIDPQEQNPIRFLMILNPFFWKPLPKVVACLILIDKLS
jgi:hypothetical protein